ncbi:high affinity immunoglobulin epsilon receptor subunit beta-like [Megalops cyprinoides]|uniref:high affinity immunoglobulin epsilon receptor subunit beta-like n=1 Tax=Megalops cyprinoides TaxID=118141 RepID=UPI001865281C|nr:high affinity immunoglobulin epsilon receptor subunit beta-like [Megalops cyprinoides]
MSYSVTKGEGVMVFTLTSDPASSCPLLCQLLGTLFCSPACAVSERLRKLLGGAQSTLGTIQIMVGLFTIALGTIFLQTYSGPYFLWAIGAPYWLGAMFIVSGILCILAQGFPSPCLVFLTMMMNLVSAILTVAGFVFYLVDEGGREDWRCRTDNEYNRYDPTKMDSIGQSNFDICVTYKPLLLTLQIGLRVMLIVFDILQFCVTISAVVLSIKALKKNNMGKDPDLKRSILEEETANPTV